MSPRTQFVYYVLWFAHPLLQTGVAGVVAASSTAASDGPIVQAILTMQTSVRLIQCGLVLFLLVFSKYLGVSWRQHSFGIALGFGTFASIELLLVALGASSLGVGTMSRSIINMSAYNCAIVVWLAYALAKSPVRDSSANMLRTQRWEQSLHEIQHPATSDSLIPMFEGMVDRALSRTKGNALVAQTEMPLPLASANAISSPPDLNYSPLSPHGIISKT